MYNQDRRFRPKFAPVNVGDELDVKVEAVGEKGDGIAKKEGFVLFIPNTKEGQEVRIKVTKVLRKVGFAEVIGESQGSSKEEVPAEEQQEPETAADESEEKTVEDTEDFGEEESKE
ncbi:TRAM domain-containing protein [Candidatus Woesearchaeota archaeon]|nr:TRAM domain-containing protein [Candidatus Woesearchaeota archaeon]